MEELTENAEEDEESKHSEQKLGKLQYKVNRCLGVWHIVSCRVCLCVCNNYTTTTIYQKQDTTTPVTQL